MHFLEHTYLIFFFFLPCCETFTFFQSVRNSLQPIMKHYSCGCHITLSIHQQSPCSVYARGKPETSCLNKQPLAGVHVGSYIPLMVLFSYISLSSVHSLRCVQTLSSTYLFYVFLCKYFIIISCQYSNMELTYNACSSHVFTTDGNLGK